MSGPSLIIIGAGIGGLSAGCYAQLSGIETHVFEMHTLPGGLCTSWDRSGYTFDGSIHHLAGCHPGSRLYAMWEELGAMPRDMLFPEDLTQVESTDGRRFTVYTDLDRLEEHMLQSFPGDAAAIRRYLRALRAMRAHDLLEIPVTGRRGMLRTLSALPTLFRWGRVSMGEAGDFFEDPFLRRAFPTIQYDWPEIPVLIHLNLLAQCVRRNYGFPAGGSLAFARSIEERFRSLGGTASYGARVERILVEGGRAVGVRLASGEEHRADAVISNAFEHTTLFDLLGKEFLDEETRRRFSRPEDEMMMGIHVSLGVRRDLSDEPHALVMLLDEPTTLGERTVDRISVELYGFDPSLAPEGKGTIKVLLNASYATWKELAQDPNRYAAEKARLALQVLRALEPRFPGLSEQLEVTDVATPLTTERVTGIGRGYAQPEGFGMDMIFSRSKSLKGLARFHWVGQSAGGGGIPGCAAMGRHAVRALCKELRTRFGGAKI